MNRDSASILSQLKDISLAVTHASEANTLEKVLERIAHVSRELVHARYAAIGVPTGDGTMEHFKVSGITREEYAKIPHMPEGRGLLGSILRDRKVIRLADMADDPRSAGFPEGHPEMTSLLGVPIQAGDKLLGSIYLSDRIDGEPFQEEDQWIIEVMASYAALAITSSRTRANERRLALLEDRERISMQLHDGVIQMLYGVGMSLELLRSSGKITEPQELQPILETLNAAIEDIRAFILDLRSHPEPHRHSLRDHFRDAVGNLRIPVAMNVVLNVPDEPSLLTQEELENVTMIVHEALSNVIRHAQADECRLHVEQDDKLLRVVVEDNGIGFDTSGKNSSGLGLRNIERRTLMLGGTLSVESTPGEGTSLTFEIPLG